MSGWERTGDMAQVRIPRDLHEKLKLYAKRERRQPGVAAAYLIERAIRDYERTEGIILLDNLPRAQEEKTP